MALAFPLARPAGCRAAACRLSLYARLARSSRLVAFSHARSFGNLDRRHLRSPLRLHFRAPPAPSSPPVLLGRGRLLRARRARPAPDRKHHSAVHSIERPSSPGNGVSGRLLENLRIFAAGDPHRHAAGRCLRTAGRFPALGWRGEPARRRRRHRCTALYPVFFAQSSLAQVDLAAAGLTLWGLEAYLTGRWRATAFWFSLAVLAKETAVLAPVALLAWEIVSPWLGLQIQREPDRLSDPQVAKAPRPSFAWMLGFACLLPVLVLCGWYAYHYVRTRYVFGNPEFFRYNVQATVDPLRILLVLGMRLWQSFGYLHLWVLTLLVVWAMTRPPLRDGQVERPRIVIPVQAVFGVLSLTYIVALAIVGGAVLARYLLTIVPFVILVAISTVWRRIQLWWVLAGIVCAAFLVAWFSNPPYGFAPEDNLAYRDYVVLHQQAESFLESNYPQARVLTAWPASDELTRPYLGYVAQ